MVIIDGDVEVNMTELQRRCSRPSCNYPLVHEECWKCVKHCDCCGCMVHGCQGKCRGKTNEDYILEAVELCWRWHTTTNDLRNSVDSGIRCMDIDDDFIISNQDLINGTGPGIAVLVRQLEHQTKGDLPSSMDQLKMLVDGGNVVSQAETERARDAQGNER